MRNKEEINIFIVDDDKLTAHAIKHDILGNFKDQKLSIFTFDAGEHVAAMIGNKPDIAIVDYHMNSVNKNAMNGVKIIELIKGNSPDTEVILCSGDGSANLTERAYGNGVHTHIVKNQQMFSKINSSLVQCLRIRELKREIRQQKKIGIFVIAVLLALFMAVSCIQVLAPHLLKNLV